MSRKNKPVRVAPFDYRRSIISEEGTLSYIRTIKDGPRFKKDTILGIDSTQISTPSPHFKLDIILSIAFVITGITLTIILFSNDWLEKLSIPRSVLTCGLLTVSILLCTLAMLGTMSRAGRSLTAINHGSFNKPEEFFETIYITKNDNPTYHYYKGSGTVLDRLYSNLPAVMDVNPTIIKSPELYNALSEYTQTVKTARVSEHHETKHSIISEMTHALTSAPKEQESTITHYVGVIQGQINAIKETLQPSLTVSSSANS